MLTVLALLKLTTPDVLRRPSLVHRNLSWFEMLSALQISFGVMAFVAIASRAPAISPVIEFSACSSI